MVNRVDVVNDRIVFGWTGFVNYEQPIVEGSPVLTVFIPAYSDVCADRVLLLYIGPPFTESRGLGLHALADDRNQPPAWFQPS